jgi:hypothetical protein
MELRSEEYAKSIVEYRQGDYSLSSNKLKMRILSSGFTASELSILLLIEVEISRINIKMQRKKNDIHYVSLTQNYIAKQIGSSKDTVSRSLNNLSKGRVIFMDSDGRGSYLYGFNTGKWDVGLQGMYDIYDFATKEKENNHMPQGQMGWEEFGNAKENSKKKPVADKTKIDNWNFNDFGKYIENEYKKILGGLGYDVGVNSFKTKSSRIRNMNMSDIVAELCEQNDDVYCKIMFKAYIDWFAIRRLEDVFKTHKFISIKLINDKQLIKSFLVDNEICGKSLSIAQINKKLASYGVIEEKTIKDRKIFELSLKNIEESANIGITRLTMTYGFVIAASYYHYKLGFTEDRIINSMKDMLDKMDLKNPHDKKGIDSMIKNTFRYCPYSDDLIFLDWQKKLPKIGGFSKHMKRKMTINPSSDDKIYRVIVE